ncbi:MAG TPA: amidase, partial [Myxococcales bacterium]|nr:amidase [Myxococcales bacterium]
DAARQEAKRADKQLSALPKDQIPPFYGVPCSIKECFQVAHMPQTSGVVARRSFRAPGDATAVARLRKAGAIILGLTNTSELCMWMESQNKVYGRTNNPYNVKRTAGGSSGGEGALIGAAGTPFGLGSDVGGSIRLPAFFNGVFGHKPSGGLVPSTGQFPMAANHTQYYLNTGPMARYSEDLMPLLRAMAGPDQQDHHCKSYKLGRIEDVDAKQTQVVMLAPESFGPVSKALRHAQHQASLALQQRGATLVHHHIPELKHASWIWAAMISKGQQGALSTPDLGNGQPFVPIKQCWQWIKGQSPHTLPGIIFSIIEQMPYYMPQITDKLCETGKKLRLKILKQMPPGTVMLCPTYRWTAPKHNHTLFTPFDFAYCGIFNVLGLPVTQVPLGLGNNGLPLGIQVVGRPGEDHLTIAIAMMLEKDFGGWQP